MRITCCYDNGCNMGYVYLLPPKENEFYEYQCNTNEITKFVNPDQLHIPYVIDLKIVPFLNQMTLAVNTFKDDHEKSYDTEYGNDMNEQGYVTGIELTLSLGQYIDLIKNQAYKVIHTEWRNRMFHVITLIIWIMYLILKM